MDVTLDYKTNKKYIRVTEPRGGVYCFVDQLGNIYKAAGRSSPAKHVRGNIMGTDNGLSCMNEHGANYLTK